MKTLSGKVALVTGGSRGIGAAIAQRLATDGAVVALTYNSSPEAAQKIVRDIEAAGGRAIALKADSADPEAVRSAVSKTVEQLGGLDILVNNAGIAPSNAIGDVTMEEFDQLVAINIRAPWVAIQESLKHMTPGGRVVTVGSSLANRVPFPNLGAYSMTKAAVAGMTRALTRELAAREITINIVEPGPIDTDMNPADGPMADVMHQATAIPRHGRVEEIAAVVAHLVSPEAAFITGAAIPVDGGFAA